MRTPRSPRAGTGFRSMSSWRSPARSPPNATSASCWRSSCKKPGRSPAPTPAACTWSRRNPGRPGGRGPDCPATPARAACTSCCRRTIRWRSTSRSFSLPVDDRSIVGQAVLGKRPINIDDLNRLQHPGENPRGLRHDRSFDQRTGYTARSMLTVPMLSAHDRVIGVVQLINRRRAPGTPLLHAGRLREQRDPVRRRLRRRWRWRWPPRRASAWKTPSCTRKSTICSSASSTPPSPPSSRAIPPPLGIRGAWRP